MNNTLWSKPQVDLGRVRVLSEGKSNSPILIAFHGWAANGDVWLEVAKQLTEFTFWVIDLPGFYPELPPPQIELESLGSFNDFVSQANQIIFDSFSLLPTQSERDIFIIGWSLGGQIAAKVACSSQLPVKGLITLASNPCFVERDDWSAAMSANTYSDFCQLFKANPMIALKRFYGLQSRGAKEPKQLRHAMNSVLPKYDVTLKPFWEATLLWLRQDTRDALAQFDKPQLHLLAEDDALVPSVIDLAKFGELQVINNCSHCLPLELPNTVARAVTVFIKTHSARQLDKKKVAFAFSSAAKNYDSFARVQKKVADKLLIRLGHQVVHQHILDIGSGTGHLTDSLAEQGARVVAADIAEGMLQFARAKKPLAIDYPIQYIASDAEQMAIADEAFEGIVSSLAVQWCASYQQLFKEVYRLLKPGGWAVLATLGPATLKELKIAWQTLDDCVHVNAFASAQCIYQAAKINGLEIASFLAESETVTYSSLLPLMREIKAIGAHNIHRNAHKGLMTRSQLTRLEMVYPTSLADDGTRQLSATYDVYYYSLFKPTLI